MCRNSIVVFSNMLRVTIALCAVALGAALELTSENWDDATAGKTVFIKVGVCSCAVTKSRKYERTRLAHHPIAVPRALVRTLQKVEAPVRGLLMY